MDPAVAVRIAWRWERRAGRREEDEGNVGVTVLVSVMLMAQF